MALGSAIRRSRMSYAASRPAAPMSGRSIPKPDRSGVTLQFPRKRNCSFRNPETDLMFRITTINSYRSYWNFLSCPGKIFLVNFLRRTEDGDSPSHVAARAGPQNADTPISARCNTDEQNIINILKNNKILRFSTYGKSIRAVVLQSASALVPARRNGGGYPANCRKGYKKNGFSENSSLNVHFIYPNEIQRNRRQTCSRKSPVF